MNYFHAVSRGCPRVPHVHPPFLSIAAAYNESSENPNISSVSEDNPRALRSNYYTSPNDVPPLDMNFKGHYSET